VPACSRLPSPFAGPLNAMCRAVCTAEERDVKKTLLAAALLCCLPAAYAADQNDASALAPVVVTATRTPITADDALSSVSVITRADIERLQPLSVADLLTGLPGISFAQSGGLGRLRPAGADPGGADRAHRDRARPALQPVRLRRDRRRDPDLHPPRPAERRHRAFVQHHGRQSWPRRCDRRAVRRRRARLVQREPRRPVHLGLPRLPHGRGGGLCRLL